MWENVPYLISPKLKELLSAAKQQILYRVLRRIFGPKRDEATGGWIKLHNEELRNLYSAPSIIRTIKARRMRWKEHVARTGKSGMHIGYW
jgi:hypothetical protein